MVGQHEVIVLAVRDYPDSPPEFAHGINSQVDVVRAWAATEGDTLTDVLSDTEIADAFTWIEGALSRTRQQGDSILLYVTGHGRAGKSHRLLRPDGMAYPLTNLIWRVMSGGAGHVVVLIDSCFAGHLKSDVDSTLEDLRVDLESAGRRLPLASCVVMSGRPEEKLRVGEFTSYLRDALQLMEDKYAVPDDEPFLSPDVFTRALRYAAREGGGDLRYSAFDGDYLTEEPCRALPNMGYRPEEAIVGDARSAVSLPRKSFDTFWLDKAAGRPEGDPGWYFRGREEINRQIAAFLSRGIDLGTNLLVVTGEAGSGKSAVIARAVTLSDSRFRSDPAYGLLVEKTDEELVPPIDSVDVAVTARGWAPQQVLSALADRIGIPVPDGPTSLAQQASAWTLRANAELGRPVAVVIDGLDEATAPNLVISDVINPIVSSRSATGQHAAKLIVGVRGINRSDKGAGVTLVSSMPHALTLRTDGPGTRTDVEAYITSLLTVDGPYVGDNVAAGEAARVIADRVSPRFIDARVVALGLRQGGAKQDLSDSAWLVTLSDATVRQLASDLVHVMRDTGRPWGCLVAVLRSIALSLGPGMPWGDVWPAAAEALLVSPSAPMDDVIREVLASRLSGYILTTEDQGQRVYRPNHQRLIEVLADEPRRLVLATRVAPEPGHSLGQNASAVLCESNHAHAQIAKALGRQATDRPPDPYTARYLISHAYLGRTLNDSTIPAAFLPYETSSSVRGSLGLPLPEAFDQTGLAAWAVVEPNAARLNRRDKVASLRFHQTTQELADRDMMAGQAWRVARNVLAQYESAVNAIAFVYPEGRTAVAIGTSGGTIQLWDLATGVPMAGPLMGHRGPVMCLASGLLDGRSTLVSGGADSTIRFWDASTGTPTAAPLTGHTGQVMSVALGEVGNRKIVVSGSSDRTVRLWDAATGLQLGHPLTGHTRSVRAVAVGSDGDRTIIASGSVDRTLRLWNAATGARHRDRPPNRLRVRHKRAMTDVAFAEVSGSHVLVTGSKDGTVRIWNHATGAPIRALLNRRAGRAEAIALGEVNGQSLLAAGLHDGSVQLWDPSTGETTGGPLAGHTGAVVALEFGRVGNRTILATGSHDGSVRIWDPAVHPPNAPATPEVPMVAFGRMDSRTVMATGSTNRGVRLLDPTIGTQVGSTFTAAQGSHISCVALGVVKGRTVLAGAARSRVQLWDAGAGTEIGGALLHGTSRVRAVAFGELGGKIALATGCSHGLVRLWDPGTRSPTPQELPGHTRAVSSLAFGYVDGHAILASGSMDRTVRLWDAVGAAMCVLQGHSRPVRALDFGSVDDAVLLGTASTDRTVRLWDPRNGAQIATWPTHHAGIVLALAFGVLDGRHVVATGSIDGSVRFWDLDGYRCIRTLYVGAPVASLSYDADGGRFAVSGPAGVAIVQGRGLL